MCMLYIESKTNPGEHNADKLTKLREVLIKKSREYQTTFPKYSSKSKKGQAWWAKICFHARDYIESRYNYSGRHRNSQFTEQ